MAEITQPFFVGANGERLSEDAIKQRRRMAEALMKSGSDYSPVQHWAQGLARVADALVGGYEMGQLDKADRAGRVEQTGRNAILMGGDIASPTTTPAPGAILGTASPNADTGSALPTSLNATESGGNWQAQNDAVGAGGAVGHFGRAQFGQARLQEAANAGAIPQGTTPQMFMKSPELQKAAENWHFGDIDQTIRANGFDKMIGQPINGVPITLGGMRAVAHLGGNRGLQRFIETGGRYNPADRNGTSLMDYFTTHGGNMRTAQADMPAPGAVPVELATGQAGFAIPPGGEDPASLRAQARDLQMSDWAGAKRLMDRAAALEASPPSSVPFAANEAEVQRLEAQMQPRVDAQVAAQNPVDLPTGAEVQPLAPVFQSEGASQPWMGSALPPSASPREAISRALAKTQTLPPARPTDLAMPQADLPAPGAVQAMGQSPQAYPLANTADPTLDNAGILSGLVASEEHRKGLPSGAGIMNPFSAIASALMANGGTVAPAASPGVQNVARALTQSRAPAASEAVAQAASAPGNVPTGAPAAVAPQAVAQQGMSPRLQAAYATMNSPYASQGEKTIASIVIQQSVKGTDFETVTRPDGSVYRVPKTGSGAPTQVFGPQSKPEERTGNAKEYDIYTRQEEAAGRKPDTFTNWERANKRAGAASVNVGGGSDKQIFDTFSYNTKEARAAADGLAAIREARGALNGVGGAITGAGAEAKLGLQKIGAALGVANSESIVNTETFRAAIQPQVAAVLKATVGSANISNSDREFAERASGGSITLDEKSIRRLLDIMERAGEARVQLHQEQLDSVYPDAEQHRKERALFGVKMPPRAAAPQAQPGQPAKPASKADFDALPSGTRFIDPNGHPRIKP
ncbi:hypothetical protein [Bosea sp. UC22_33]|uniref:hypothetical protein n=1 Tax=Bosea sp. UC22_33 TaxID=3350165 RepID=UPI00366F1FA5